MLQNESISVIMTEDVRTIEIGRNLADAIEILAEFSVDHVPVVSDGQLAGMISSTDVMNYTMKLVSESPDLSNISPVEGVSVEDVMETDLITLHEDSTAHDAAEILATGQVHSVPIVDDDNLLVGIITSTDLINYLLNQMDITVT